MKTSPIEQATRTPWLVLVTQLGDESEIYRSLMAFKAVTHLYPNVKIHFLVRAKFLELLSDIPWVEKVIPLPEEATTSAQVAAWISSIADQAYDLSFHWTYRNEDRYLSSLIQTVIPSLVKLGKIYDFNQQQEVSLDAWAVLTDAWLKNGIKFDIHYTDILTTQFLTALQIHMGEPQPSENTLVLNKDIFRFSNLEVKLSKKYRWVLLETDSLPVDCSELAQKILEQHPEWAVVVVGSGVVGLRAQERIVSISHASAAQSAQWATQIQWVISGTSFWVPLASLLGIKIIQVTESADPQTWVLGPYANGAWVMNPIQLGQEEQVYQLWCEALNPIVNRKNIPQDTFLSRIRSPQEGGGVVYDRVHSKALHYTDWFSKIRAQLVRGWFCGWTISSESEVSKMTLSSDLVARVRKLKDCLSVLKKVFEEGRTLAISLSQETEHLSNQHLMPVSDREKIENYSKQLLEVEALFSKVVQMDEELVPLLKLYQQFMSHLKGVSISELAIETASVFQLLQDGLVFIEEYVHLTLETAKPKAISAVRSI